MMTSTFNPMSLEELETKIQLRRSDLMNLEMNLMNGRIKPDEAAVRVTAISAVLVSLDKERKRRAKYPS